MACRGEAAGVRARRPTGRATDREVRVVAAFLDAGSEKAAAHRLGLSHSTVKHQSGERAVQGRRLDDGAAGMDRVSAPAGARWRGPNGERTSLDRVSPNLALAGPRHHVPEDRGHHALADVSGLVVERKLPTRDLRYTCVVRALAEQRLRRAYVAVTTDSLKPRLRYPGNPARRSASPSSAILAGST